MDAYETRSDMVSSQQLFIGRKLWIYRENLLNFYCHDLILCPEVRFQILFSRHHRSVLKIQRIGDLDFFRLFLYPIGNYVHLDII